MKLFKLKKKGFTLLELLIVISIIGILVAVGAASYSSAQQKARDSRRKSDIKAVQNAAEQYYAENSNAYPNSKTFGTVFLPAGFPKDPKWTSSGTYLDYSYTVGPASCTTGCTLYCTCADLESTGGNATSMGNTAAGHEGECEWSATPTTATYYCLQNLQ